MSKTIIRIIYLELNPLHSYHLPCFTIYEKRRIKSFFHRLESAHDSLTSHLFPLSDTSQRKRRCCRRWRFAIDGSRNAIVTRPCFGLARPTTRGRGRVSSRKSCRICFIDCARYIESETSITSSFAGFPLRSSARSIWTRSCLLFILFVFLFFFFCLSFFLSVCLSFFLSIFLSFFSSFCL